MDLGFIADGLVGVFTSSGLAGITGAVSAHFATKQENKIKALEFTHLENMADYSLKEGAAERAHDLARATKDYEKVELEGEIVIEGKEVDAFAKSQQDNNSGQKEGAIRWVRPVITGYLLILATYLSYKVFQVTGGIGALEKDIQIELLTTVIDSVFFLATLAVGWFFGSRGKSKK